ncbi:SDR family oxidoreductase [Isoptericola sp. NEAU-Y5]|uniref:SDR family oxidoreductase n=1 Tax=Isoptericola luteus TaxID=2879484 RepID=A0ABS7ZEX8_9MICO|nr:NAD(P)-binding oxidoreductase [Isoptericola sp. NEAU-Y5]MCA5893473.1 SDR family oxidoreductase [Isoptericola sp. NEAU-Y5]
MDVLVVGATRGTGRAVTEELVARGHDVTAFGRTASAAYAPTRHHVPGPGTVRAVDGDVLDPDAVAKALVGQDAVVVTLGISDNPLAVQYLRRAGTAPDVRSRGTAVLLEQMRLGGPRRVVVQTTYGLGDSWQHLDLTWKLVFRLVIGRQLVDSARQEEAVRDSGLAWTVVRPVSLTDAPWSGPARVTTDDSRGALKVSRAQVAHVLADALDDAATVGATLSVSA